MFLHHLLGAANTGKPTRGKVTISMRLEYEYSNIVKKTLLLFSDYCIFILRAVLHGIV